MVVQTVNGGWGLTYSNPETAHPLASLTGVDSLTLLGPQWEWNHVPDTTKYSTSSSGLLLKTATVTFDIYAARNTLTRLGQSHPWKKQSTWYHVPSKQKRPLPSAALFHHHLAITTRCNYGHSSPPRDPSVPAGHFANATFPLEVASSDRQPGLTRPDTARGAIPWLMTSGGRSELLSTPRAIGSRWHHIGIPRMCGIATSAWRAARPRSALSIRRSAHENPC
jgi:hypothetical protein